MIEVMGKAFAMAVVALVAVSPGAVSAQSGGQLPVSGSAPANVMPTQSRPAEQVPRTIDLKTTQSVETCVPTQSVGTRFMGANEAAKLRAAPLPADSLARGPVSSGTSTYSAPYGPHLTRPSGSAIVPFGSSRYYYRR